GRVVTVRFTSIGITRRVDIGGVGIGGIRFGTRDRRIRRVTPAAARSRLRDETMPHAVAGTLKSAFIAGDRDAETWTRHARRHLATLPGMCAGPAWKRGQRVGEKTRTREDLVRATPGNALRKIPIPTRRAQRWVVLEVPR